MPTISLSPLAGAGWQFFDDDGAVLSLGELYIYAAGTTTPAVTYTDNTAGPQNTNPIVLAADGRISTQIWLDTSGSYKFVLVEAGGSPDTPIWSEDDINPVVDFDVLAGVTGASLVGTADGGTVQDFIDDITNTDGTGGTMIYVKAPATSVALTLQDHVSSRVDVREFNVKLDSLTMDEANWQTAFDAGVPLWFPAVDGAMTTSYIGGPIDVPDGLDLLCESPFLCRMEKRYYKTSSIGGENDPFLRPADVTATGVDNVIIRNLQVGGIPGALTSGSDRSGKLIRTGMGKNWILENIYANYWDGFGVTLEGAGGHHAYNMICGNSGAQTGTDFIHVAGNSDPNNPITIRRVRSLTAIYADCVGLFPIIPNPGNINPDQDIFGVIVDDVGAELYGLGRVLAMGLQNADTGLTASLGSVRATNIFGKIGTTDHGVVYIYHDRDSGGTAGQQAFTGVIRDIYIQAVCNGEDAGSFAKCYGPRDNTPELMHDITLDISSMSGTTGPGAGQVGIDLYGHINNLNLTANISCPNADYGIAWLQPNSSKNWKINAHIYAGTDDVFYAPSTTEDLSDGQLNLVAENIANGAYAVHPGKLLNSCIDVMATKATGATTSKGVNELEDCSGNIWTGDLTGVDTTYGLVQKTSDHTGTRTGVDNTVEQITSRFTTVTCDANNGQITLFSEAGSATIKSFSVANSFVDPDDCIIVWQLDGTDKYEINVTAVNLGAFRLTFYTDGTTVEQPVFGFKVVKTFIV